MGQKEANGTKPSKLAQTYTIMGHIYAKWSKLGQNRAKWSKLGRIDAYWSKLVKNQAN